MDRPAFETAEAHATPTIRQFSIFLEDRVGQLVRLTRVFETTDVHILGLSMVYSVDCSIVRLIVDQPDMGYDMITTAGFPLCESELLAISMPVGKRGLLSIWSALLTAEINIAYVYPLFSRPKGRSCIALKADDLEAAYRALLRRDFYVLDEADLRSGF
ncbi:MAG: hypothetical protein HJJLKODD_01380 [Phycisphaerae bacterium]|nr:hypothetical protein [Phycisphaerae bacterium]